MTTADAVICDDAADALTTLRRERDEALAREAGLREVLRKLAAPTDCGCWPCTGQCRSQESLTLELEARMDAASAALSTPAPQPSPVGLCDCERGHNGFGMAGRECDCQEQQPPPAANTPGLERAARWHEARAATQEREATEQDLITAYGEAAEWRKMAKWGRNCATALRALATQPDTGGAGSGTEAG